MKMRRTKGTVALLIAGAMLISLTLSSCRAFMKEVSMDVTAVGKGELIPVVEGFWSNSDINARLSEEFRPLAERMKEITDGSDDRLSVRYVMAEKKKSVFGGEYTVTMYLTDSLDNTTELKTVKISGTNKVEPQGSDNSDWIVSAEVAESVLMMQGYGLDTDKSALAEYSTERNAAETFVSIYEGICGSELDTSAVTVAEDDPLVRKMLLLGFINYYGDSGYQFDERAYVYTVTEYAAAALTAIERDVFGRQSESVTGEEFSRMLLALHSVIRAPVIEGSNHVWTDLGEVDTDGIISSMDMTDKPFTRRDAAELVGRMTKNGPKYSMKYTDRNLSTVEDAADSIWARRAISHGFMNYYGDSTLFAPQEGLTVVNAVSSAKCYMNTRYSDWADSVNYAWNGAYTNADVVIAAASVARYFDDRTDVDREFEVKSVVNDRDYDWFFSQKDTGKYSSINCMPSIATMASHWYDKNSKATVKKMRATSSYEDGWTAYELRNGLSAYDVPYTVVDATLENITDALDNGKIVLAQYSDRPWGVSGHCYVIYGYRRFKDSITFIVNDSDSLTQRSQIFGRKMGQGDEIEASFSMWTISRFVDDVTVVSSEEDN